VAAADARDAVIAVRRRKGMVTDPTDPDSRSAGSFFTNPVITQAEYERVSVRSAIPVPSYDAGEGLVKVPAAWLIEHAGFVKGYAAHGARISTKHTLALTNPGSATTAGLLALARDIREGVEAAFGVTLTPEPILIGASL
jgi:UDP-N-acetylmuramate dehydrogenase